MIANINTKWLERWSSHLEHECSEYDYDRFSPREFNMKKLKCAANTYDNCNTTRQCSTLILSLLNSISLEDFSPGPTR